LRRFFFLHRFFLFLRGTTGMYTGAGILRSFRSRRGIIVRHVAGICIEGCSTAVVAVRGFAGSKSVAKVDSSGVTATTVVAVTLFQSFFFLPLFLFFVFGDSGSAEESSLDLDDLLVSLLPLLMDRSEDTTLGVAETAALEAAVP
jgi:hypothetical protein